MAAGRTYENWNHTATTLATLVNVHGGAGDGRPCQPLDFHYPELAEIHALDSVVPAEEVDAWALFKRVSLANGAKDCSRKTKRKSEGNRRTTSERKGRT